MRFFLFLILLTNISMANDYGNYLPDPFSKKKKINFSYNDISNYPIGIFDLNKKIDETVFTINRDFSQIQIKSYSIGYHNIFFYQDSFENYISDLFESNQKYNLFKGLNVPSDSTSSKKDTFLQLASIDLGALGRASLKVAGNVNLSAKLVNQDQELVRSSFREQEKTNFKFDQKQQLNVQGKIGDKITLMSPSGIETIIGSMPKQKTFIVHSIFNSGLADFDNNIALINLDTLDEFFGYEIKDRNLEIYLINPKNIEYQKNIIKNIFDEELIYTWADMNSSLFSALKVERNVMFIILSLIIIVAAFNIISGLTIFVKNKTREIAILKSIGVQNKSIQKIFFIVGLSIGSLATICGILFGVLFSIYIENIRIFLSKIFNLSLFPEEIYFLSKMPYALDIKSIFLISICSIVSTCLVSLFPAIKASNLDTIKSLKYE